MSKTVSISIEVNGAEHTLIAKGSLVELLAAWSMLETAFSKQIGGVIGIGEDEAIQLLRGIPKG